MTTLITAEMLREAGACDPGLAWLSEHHPGGATWHDLVASLAHRPDWGAWLGRYCPAGVEGATWEARLAVQRDDYDRARLVRYCPAGVEGDPR